MTRTPIEDHLSRAVADLHHRLDGVPIPDPPTRPPVRPRRVVVATVAAAAAVALLVVATPVDFADRDRAATTSRPVASTVPVGLPAEGPVFGEETGVVLLLDDGIDGLTAIDPDRRLAARSVVEGQRAGDPEHRMVLVGDHLVVGWGEPHAVDLATRDATALGEATVFVPAAEPGRVWMVDAGSNSPEEPARVWQVDVATGATLNGPVAQSVGGSPQLGISGGLAVQTGDGLHLWHSDTTETTLLSDRPPGFALNVHGDDLAWCSGDCAALTVTDTSALTARQYQPPEGYDYFHDATFSPDGRWLSALVGYRGEPEGRAIWILNHQSQDTQVVSDPDTRVDYLAWLPDSTQLFASSYAYGQAATTVWRYNLTEDRFGAVVLPIGGTLTPVVVDRSVADAYIGNDIRSPDECWAPMGQPSGRSGICTFDY